MDNKKVYDRMIAGFQKVLLKNVVRFTLLDYI